MKTSSLTIKSAIITIVGIFLNLLLYVYAIEKYFFDHPLLLWKITAILYALFLISGIIWVVRICFFSLPVKKTAFLRSRSHPVMVLLILAFGSGLFVQIFSTISFVYGWYGPGWASLLTMFKENGFTVSLAALLSGIGIWIPGKSGYFLSMLYPLMWLSLLVRQFIFDSSIMYYYIRDAFPIVLVFMIFVPIFLNHPKVLSYFGIRKCRQQLFFTAAAFLLTFVSVVWINIYKYYM